MKPQGQDRATPILAPTDFSDSAAVGIRWAMELARERRRPLHLVHALAPTAWPLEYTAPDPGLLPGIERSALRRLERIVSEVDDEGVEATFEIRSGRPSEVVLDVARARRAALVVLATRGLAGLDHVLLGSTAERVVRRAPCPVLTLRGEGAHAGRSVRRVLVATDFAEKSAAACMAALELLTGTPDGAAVATWQILLVHAYEVPYDLGAGGSVTSAAAASELCESTRCHALCKLEAAAEEFRRTGVEVEIAAAEGTPPEVILEMARSKPVDVVAMGTHGRTGLRHAILGSSAERVVRLSPCPVLTVRREVATPLATAPGVG